MKTIIIVLLVAISISVQPGCSGDNTINATADIEYEVGDTLYVELGESCTISLKACFTCGYSWAIVQKFHRKYIELESYNIVDFNPEVELEGEAKLQEWTYLTKEQGTVCCTLVYKRVWEEDPELIKKITVIIE